MPVFSVNDTIKLLAAFTSALASRINLSAWTAALARRSTKAQSSMAGVSCSTSSMSASDSVETSFRCVGSCAAPTRVSRRSRAFLGLARSRLVTSRIGMCGELSLEV